VKLKELQLFLDDKADLYNNPNFIETDPIQIPHKFSKKEDIEIAGFLSSVIAWGNRKMIIKNGLRMMELLEESPFDFVINHTPKDLYTFDNFVHRTFNIEDFKFFISALNNIYKYHQGLEQILLPKTSETDYQQVISRFKSTFFEIPHPIRTEKHLPNPLKSSAAKRMVMFLRWMVRQDYKGVDFGIWKTHNPSKLSCPLDVHSGNVARKLGILTRKQNDWKSVSELDHNLRALDKNDPSKYDFALFGLGVFEKF